MKVATWAEINAVIKNRRFALFGAGEWSAKASLYLNGSPSYIFDNNPNMWGAQQEGVNIVRFDPLQHIGLFIIVTSSGYDEIAFQLQGNGWSASEDFVISPHFEVHINSNQLNQLAGDLYFSSSDQSLGLGGIYKLDLFTGEVRHIYRGICHGFVIQSDHIVATDDVHGLVKVSLQDGTSSVLFQPEKSSRMHGLDYCSEREQYALALSGQDRILILDKVFQTVDKLSISDKFILTGSAQHHVNDVAFSSFGIVASCFSLTGNWKAGIFDGSILEWNSSNPDQPALMFSNLYMPHSPRYLNDSFYFLDSGRSKLVSGSLGNVMTVPGFVRGLDFRQGFVAVGVSRLRYLSRRIRSDVPTLMNSGIVILDLSNSLMRFYDVKLVSDINTIRFPRVDA